MSLGFTPNRMPRAFDADLGREARDACPWARDAAADLIAGAGGSSPYLHGLIQRHGDWLEGALSDPDAALAALCTEMEAAAPDAAPAALRLAKARMALCVALVDLAGGWPVMRVTGALTDFADRAVGCALRAALAPVLRRGLIPDHGPDDAADGAGMVVLAMGKMGAGELNYSSDIDLICLFDETRYAPADYATARAGFVRATRAMTAMLSDVTQAGYVFRTDLRLRPDPSVTPVVIGMAAAERYYESMGRTWERAAMIKARPIAGDIAAGQAYLDRLAPFIWRRHLDFAAIRDAHDIRAKIRSRNRDHGPITLPGHNIKLGRGGIREIEFYTQTRQLIAGGRDPRLRARETLAGLDALATQGWIGRADADALADHYKAHRVVEHRLQMVGDAQTHSLPQNEDGFDRIAALMGQESAALKADIARRLTEVHDLAEPFFARQPAGPGAGDAPDCPIPDSLRDSPLVARWPSYPALRAARAAEMLDRLQPQILGALAQAPRPDDALVAFDAFLAGLPAGVQILSLFEANSHLIALLVDIVATAPDLGRYLARNPQVFDAVLGGAFFGPWPGRAALRAELADSLAPIDDYEYQLDQARRWWREKQFRIGVHLLRGLMDAEEAGRAYADLAEATVSALFPVVQAQFALRHGAAPGRGAVVLGMGSLGAGRLHARSDLDLIVVYNAPPDAVSDGPKPLAAPVYYARLTQALIAGISAQTAEGRMYQIDLRLRPSGNQGPVATSFAAFRTYQAEQAWTWEHLALTRARVIAGPAALAADVEEARQQVLSEPRARRAVFAALADMRDRIARSKTAQGGFDAKIGPGRMQDIELFAQAFVLCSPPPVRQTPRAIARARILPQEDRDTLRAAYALQWAVQIAGRLISDGPIAPDKMGQSGRDFLARLTNRPTIDSVEADLIDGADRAAAVIRRALDEAGKDPSLEDGDEQG